MHVPREFTEDSPAIAFSATDLSHLNIADDARAQKLPEAEGKAYTIQFPDRSDFECFAASKNCPKTINEMIASRAPQLSVHFTTFNDATLLGLSFPHTLLDGGALYGLLKNWSLMLSGKEEQVQEVLGAREDIFAVLDEPNTAAEKLALSSKHVSGLRMTCFRLHCHWYRFWYPPCETRIIFLPCGAVSKIKNGNPRRVFVSDNDVFSAWISKTIISAGPGPPAVSIMHMVDLRNRLSLLRGEAVYLQNMILTAVTLLDKYQAKGSVMDIAIENRQQLTKQLTEEQTSALLRLTRRVIRSGGGTFPVLSKPRSRVVMVNNLSKMSSLEAVNFESAIIKEGKGSRTNPPGTMLYYLHRPMTGHSTLWDNFKILCKDQGGNYWLRGTTSKEAWAKFDDELKSLS